MSIPKKYTLLKPLPMCSAGTTFSRNWIGNYECIDNKGLRFQFSQETVEDNPTWFEEVKPAKIEVNVHECCDCSRKVYASDFRVPIEYRHKFGEIKAAIERILNNEWVSWMSGSTEVAISYDGVRVYVGGQEYVSKNETRQIRMDAFIAAREVRVDPYTYTVRHPRDARFIDSVDYLDSIGKK